MSRRKPADTKTTDTTHVAYDGTAPAAKRSLADALKAADAENRNRRRGVKQDVLDNCEGLLNEIIRLVEAGELAAPLTWRQMVAVAKEQFGYSGSFETFRQLVGRHFPELVAKISSLR